MLMFVDIIGKVWDISELILKIKSTWDVRCKAKFQFRNSISIKELYLFIYF